MTPQENLIKYALREISQTEEMLTRYPQEERSLNNVINGWQAVILRLQQDSMAQPCSEAGI